MYMEVGQKIQNATDSYNSSIASYERRLLVTSRDLSKLGVSEGEHPTPKRIDVGVTLPSKFEPEED